MFGTSIKIEYDGKFHSVWINCTPGMTLEEAEEKALRKFIKIKQLEINEETAKKFGRFIL